MTMSRPHHSARVAALLLSICLAGCATMPHVDRPQPDDPLESLNRAVFDTNTALDTALIKPIAETYRAILPQWTRDRIRSVIDNLAEPRIFVNDLLQRRPDAAGVTFARFFINTIVGLAGMFDLAAERGFAKQSGDFGQTLYTWGVDDGPYLVLLLLGPSNLRDAFGLGVDVLTTPPALIASSHANLAVGVVDGIDLRARNIETLDEIKASALDYYAHLKSIMQQRRQIQLLEARGVKDQPYELTDPGTSVDEPQK
ncbi:MAG: VacJ family lipoprotein [Betaproteobacteria bacterium]|nr:MAG: VacJ family lipoprotein [Betaproteobacteria bacterium]